MEKLKTFQDLMSPDSRHEAFSVIDDISGHFRPLTLRDVYGSAASIELHDGVPEVIRSHFAVAQTLLVYSWFFYPFNVTAEFLAYVTLELALKERFKVEVTANGKRSFKALVKLAVTRGLVRDDGFTHIRGRSETLFADALEPRNQPLKSYTDILIDSLPYLRNELAHGSPMLHPNGAASVRISADFINQLFPKSAS